MQVPKTPSEKDPFATFEPDPFSQFDQMPSVDDLKAALARQQQATIPHTPKPTTKAPAQAHAPQPSPAQATAPQPSAAQATAQQSSAAQATSTQAPQKTRARRSSNNLDPLSAGMRRFKEYAQAVGIPGMARDLMDWIYDHKQVMLVIAVLFLLVGVFWNRYVSFGAAVVYLVIGWVLSRLDDAYDPIVFYLLAFLLFLIPYFR